MGKQLIDYEGHAPSSEGRSRDRSAARSRLIALPIFMIACLLFAAQMRDNMDASRGSVVLAVCAAVAFLIEYVVSLFR